MKREEFIRILKVQQWSKCKGELQALIELEGSNETEYDGNHALEGRWRKLDRIISNFIEALEDEGLHE